MASTPTHQGHPRPPASSDEPDPKRRKVRKGTRSCWECKRRKIRCNFAAPGNAVCDGCARRATTCVSQEFPDEPSPLTTPGAGGVGRMAGDRLGRMEALVEMLVKTHASSGGDLIELLRVTALGGGEAMSGSTSHSPQPELPTPDPSEATASSTNSPFLTWDGEDAEAGLESETIAGSRPVMNPHRPAVLPGGATVKPGQGTGKYAELCAALVAAWPSQADLDIIMAVAHDTSGMLHQVITTPYNVLLERPRVPLATVLRFPPPGSHPILLARALIVLATVLQHLHPSVNLELAALSVPHQELMRRSAEVAISLVTTNDELVGSIEGLEAIALEGIFQANSGNLRRAWLSYRRAIVLGQMMGLHRGSSSPALKIVDLATRERADPAHMWFRVVQLDRNLSLLLGLPPGTTEDHFAMPAELGETALGVMEHTQTVIAGKILARNERDRHDVVATQEIDVALQRASMGQPPQWWLPPDLSRCPTEGLTLFRETIRTYDHINHYHLIVQTHLPYMLRFGEDARFDYNRMACANASREILSRYIAFRTFNQVAFTCRGVDFFAFIACMALCLAHLDAHNHAHSAGCAGVNYLGHQRLGDRGMMERVLDNMEDLSKLNDDILSEKSAIVLRRMLAIEADAAAGSSYSATEIGAAGSAGCDEPPPSQQQQQQQQEEANVLRICVPYFGTIKIAKEGVSKSHSPEIPASANASDPLPCDAEAAACAVGEGAAAASAGGHVAPSPSPPPPAGPAGYRVGGPSANADWQAVPSFAQGLPAAAVEDAPADGGGDTGVFSFTDGAQDSALLVPGLAAGSDDWAFQGVDMAFFDSLFRGEREAGEDASTWNRWIGNEGVVSVTGSMR